MTDKTTFIEFPCDFPIKIIGVNTDNFIADITAIVHKHFPTTAVSFINHKASEHGNYLSITATVHAHDQLSLDALYSELTQYPGIKMVL